MVIVERDFRENWLAEQYWKLTLLHNHISVNMGQMFIKVSGEGHEAHEDQKVFLKTLQILQENICVGVSF